MSIEKLHRLEELDFSPSSKIKFKIERHRATINSFASAHLYGWSIDLDKKLLIAIGILKNEGFM